MVDYLFICSHNMGRSPTAEHVARTIGLTADSAGTDLGAIRRLTVEQIVQADRIVCMEERHAQVVARIVPKRAKDIEVWNIPDNFSYCQPELVDTIKTLLGR